MQAPSSKNSSPWEFVVVDDKNLLEKLSHAHHKANHIKDANVCIVVVGNKDRFLNQYILLQDIEIKLDEINEFIFKTLKELKKN